jgi:membrane associated rhomboid family serine protease
MKVERVDRKDISIQHDAAIAREVLRPLRASTLIFAAASLVSGLSANDIDNANHLGGLVAGLFMGLALVRPIDQRTPD